MALCVPLDTPVLVAGLQAQRGASYPVLRLAERQRIIPLATPPLFLEYEDVLQRAQQQLAHGFSTHEIQGLLSEVAALIELVEVHFRLRPQLTDPKDEMVLEAAVNGRASALITHNIADFLQAGRRFRLPTLTPAQLLA
jgi:putative PIN family toxin of toxin-antitoxin system